MTDIDFSISLRSRFSHGEYCVTDTLGLSNYRSLACNLCSMSCKPCRTLDQFETSVSMIILHATSNYRYNLTYEQVIFVLEHLLQNRAHWTLESTASLRNIFEEWMQMLTETTEEQHPHVEIASAEFETYRTALFDRSLCTALIDINVFCNEVRSNDSTPVERDLCRMHRAHSQEMELQLVLYIGRNCTSICLLY